MSHSSINTPRRRNWYKEQLKEEEEATTKHYPLHMVQRRSTVVSSSSSRPGSDNTPQINNDNNHDAIQNEVNNNTDNHENANENDDNDDAMEDDLVGLPPMQGFFPLIGFAGGQDLVQEERIQRAIEEQEAEAARIIEIAVEQYRSQGVPEDEFEVIPMLLPEDDLSSATLRRICFGIIFVVGAFIFLMLQTIPFLSEEKSEKPYPIFDKVLYELLHVKSLESHHLDGCDGFARDNTVLLHGEGGFWNKRGKGKGVDCGDGVLHVPSTNVLQMYSNTTSDDPSAQQKRNIYSPYQNGVNISWFHPCVLKSHPSCFRGVHDGIINTSEVDDALRLAGELVSQGSDHSTIYTNVSTIYEHLPSIVDKVESVLRSTYGTPQIRPVAYRFSVSVPMDGSAMKRQQKASENNDLLGMAVNKSVYVSWGRKVSHINEWPVISFPPLISSKLYRDPCILWSDLDANDQYVFHSSVFLSDGTGGDFTGGVTLYVDNHESNVDPRKKIQRGVTIDGSRGRIVVSTGGAENMRCRFPTRTGIRSVLQIWWDWVDTPDLPKEL